jgi:hypothetical protein
MRKPLRMVIGALFLAVVLPGLARADAESDAKEAFVALQAALKAGDADKIWPLLDSATQKAVEKNAAALFGEYDKANATGKTQLEKLFGLTPDEMGKLKMMPKLYCKSKRFIGQWHELPGSKITQVSLDGDKAILKYTEEDGDKEEMKLSKQDGKWKIVLPSVR